MNTKTAYDIIDSAQQAILRAREISAEVDLERATRNEDQLYMAVLALITVCQKQNDLLKRLVMSAASR